MTTKTLSLTLASILWLTTAFAKPRIPFGKVDHIEIVADLTNTANYVVKENAKQYLYLARLHQEYNIAWIIPVWVTKEPKLVLAEKNSAEYFELTEKQINQILAAHDLDKEKLLGLGFYTRYGGKLILLLLLGLILLGIFYKEKPNKTTAINV